MDFGIHVLHFCILIACTSSEASGEPAHPRSLARVFAGHMAEEEM